MLQYLRSKLWDILVKLYPQYLRVVYKMNIGVDSQISWHAILDKSINPRGIHIGSRCLITRGVILLAHDASRNIKQDIHIGDDVFIGVNAIILPGVRIGNHCIIGAGTIVTKDFPDHSIIAGNPAKVIRENFE